MFSDDLLNKLLTAAKEAYQNGEIPVAAAVIDKVGNIISLCSNSRQKEHSVINHAEILAIINAEEIIGDWRLDGYSLVSTLEPCDMCYSVIKECRLDSVYFILPRVKVSNPSNVNSYELSDYVSYKEKFNELLTDFFEKMR